MKVSSQMINLITEDRISIREAARLLATDDKPVCVATVMRWILRGTQVAGEPFRVRLEAVRSGRAWLTSREAVQRFIARQTPRLDYVPAGPPTHRRFERRNRAAELAGKELAKIGF